MASKLLFDHKNPSAIKDMSHEPKEKVRSDYKPDAYRIETADAYYNIDPTLSTVSNTMLVEANEKAESRQGKGPLVLNGEDIDLTSIKINGRELDPSEYDVNDKELTIKNPPAAPFELKIENQFSPEENTKLQGIYSSGDVIGSQNESQGYRRITYFLDRPDNLTKFRTTIEADKAKFPIMISNGNGDLTKTEDLGNGRHRISWDDFRPKPSYLFALIAGDMAVVTKDFTYPDGHVVAMRAVVPHAYADKAAWALESATNTLNWMWDKYGLKYEHNTLHLIGMEKFNMGAMENPTAIVFNIKDLCGTPDDSTDAQLLRKQLVVAHELIHYWFGDEVTVRDWFEISLKESLTEMHNEMFSGDMNSDVIQLIDDVTYLRNIQFREDAGPTAHCVRPERVEAFENIYSPTVYQKGAQVLRMMKTIAENKEPGMWKKIIQSYINTYKGQAVTVDDFIDNVQKVSGIDMTQFRLWYAQSGTPQVSYEGAYDAEKKTYTLKLKQFTPDTPGQPADGKKPFYIPMHVGLIDEASGADVADKLLTFDKAEQTFVFENVNGPVVPSLLRDFSAPVKIATPQPASELIFRMEHDSNSFNHFDAANQLMTTAMLKLLGDYTAGKKPELPADLVAAYGTNVTNAAAGDHALMARMLQLPAFAASLKGVDPVAVAAVQKFVAKTLAETFKDGFQEIFTTTTTPAGEEYKVAPEQVGRRDLHNTALSFLKQLQTPAVTAEAKQQYDSATNMTDRFGALQALIALPGDAGAKALANFHDKFNDDTNVMDTWLTLSAQIPGGDAIARVKELMKSDVYDLTNPNKVRALMAGLTSNTDAFHNIDGAGYKLLADVVISLNKVNPHTAAGIVSSLVQYDRYDAARQQLMLKQLERIAATPKLDSQIGDPVGKALKTAKEAAEAAAKTTASRKGPDFKP